MFLRSNTFTSSGGYLLAPYNTVHKFAAIVLDDVERVVVGDSATVLPNVLSGSRYGIVAKKSGVEVFNTTFNDFTSYDESWSPIFPNPLPELRRSSVCIYNLSDFDFNDRHLRVGEREEETNITHNTFKNADFGIWSDKESNVEVHYSDFGGGDLDEIVGMNCIRINYPGNKSVDVSRENTFSSYRFGVRIWTPLAGTSINVSENDFFNGFSVNNQFTGTGIFINDWGGVQPLSVSIHDNTFGLMSTDPTPTLLFPRIGIRLANIFNTVSVEDNNFSFDFTGVPDDVNTGIWLMNCPKAKIAGNSIENISSPGNIEDFNQQLVGLNIQNSMLTCIDDQQLTYLGQPMRFFGNSNVQSLYNNSMDHFSNGVFLDRAEIGQIIPGVNTAGGSTYVDWVNTWIQPGGADVNRRIAGTKIFPFPIDWWHSASGNTDSDFPGGDASLVNKIPIPSNSTIFQGSLCPVENVDEPPFDLTARNANFGAVAADTARYEEYYNHSRYEASLELFRLLKKYPSMMDFDDDTDTSFQYFYEGYANTNIEKVGEVMDFVQEARYSEALDIVSSLSDTCYWETNFKSVMTRYLQYITGEATFTGSDSLLLDSIAHLNLYAFGLPVQLARNILDLEIYDIPEGESRIAQPVKLKRDTGPLVLIPNPAKQNVHLVVPADEKIEQVLVFDSTGRLVGQETEVNVIDITALLNSIYQVQVNTDVKSRQGKLVILK